MCSMLGKDIVLVKDTNHNKSKKRKMKKTRQEVCITITTVVIEFTDSV